MSDCIYTRAECHHKGHRCSECPITDLICDEFTDCLDLSYQQGREDEQKRFIKILVDLFGDEPCNFNDMDECTDGWCERFCGEGNHTVFDCWEHAINSGWIKEQKDDD